MLDALYCHGARFSVSCEVILYPTLRRGASSVSFAHISRDTVIQRCSVCERDRVKKVRIANIEFAVTHSR